MSTKCKVILSLVTALSVTSCATTTVNQGSKIALSLTPHHQEYYTFHEISDHEDVTKIVDNDGNLYVTHWALPELKNDQFKANELACTKSTGPWFFTGKPAFIDQIAKEDIRPSNYKSFAYCMIDHNYKINKSDGFFPKGYDVQVSRSHSNKGEYVPVGGTIYIEGNGKSYLEIYNNLKSCDDKIRKRLGMPVMEQEFNEIVVVSIETYFEELISCTTGKPYKIDDKQWGATKKSETPEIKEPVRPVIP